MARAPSQEAPGHDECPKRRDRLPALPDAVAVWPTHGAGSFCSAPAGGERTTTIGRERAANPYLTGLGAPSRGL